METEFQKPNFSHSPFFQFFQDGGRPTTGQDAVDQGNCIRFTTIAEPLTSLVIGLINAGENSTEFNI